MDYTELKQQYDEMKEAQTKAETKKEMLMEQLEKFGCKTVEEAEAKLEELKLKKEKAEARLEKQITVIKEALNVS